MFGEKKWFVSSFEVPYAGKNTFKQHPSVIMILKYNYRTILQLF